MHSSIQHKISSTATSQHIYQPVFFRLHSEGEKERFEQLCQSGEVVFIHDEIWSQLKELVKCLNPSVVLTPEQAEAKIEEHLQGADPDTYGVWVYYPWSKTVVHLLDEEEFILVRTNRNQLKITKEEQEQLRRRTIGIVGLSVGQSIALTLAVERTCGHIKLADFDLLELSNMNRLRTGVRNLGLQKVVIAAREIAELDPFIKVELFDKGLQPENMEAFLGSGTGKIDMLVEVCDGLDMKIICRNEARERGIPVVMDTNDRGMLDIERFDLEPARPIMHGLLEGIPIDNIAGLTGDQRTQLILKIVGAESISHRLKLSIGALQKTIGSLPQLASSVVLGGAVTTDVCRRILLGELMVSGRYYVDLDEIIR